MEKSNKNTPNLLYLSVLTDMCTLHLIRFIDNWVRVVRDS